MTPRVSGIDDAAWASPWRGVPVGAKVIFSITLIVVALIARPWPTAVLVLVLGLGVLAAARIPARLVAVAFSAPAVFIVLGAASATVTLGEFAGEGWRWGPVGVRRVDVGLGVGLLLRSVAGTCALFVLAMTTPMVDLLAWLRRLRIPEPLIEVASLMYRMIFTAWNSLLQVRQAQQQRLGGAGSMHRRLSETGRLIGAVAVRTWLASARLADGLAIRGHETSLTTLPSRRPSRRMPPWALAGVVVILGVALWTR